MPKLKSWGLCNNTINHNLQGWETSTVTYDLQFLCFCFEILQHTDTYNVLFGSFFFSFLHNNCTRLSLPPIFPPFSTRNTHNLTLPVSAPCLFHTSHLRVIMCDIWCVSTCLTMRAPLRRPHFMGEHCCCRIKNKNLLTPILLTPTSVLVGWRKALQTGGGHAFLSQRGYCHIHECIAV